MTKERTFEEIIADTNKSIENIIEIGKYWRARCKAAERVVDSSPPNAAPTEDFINAFYDWKEKSNNFPEEAVKYFNDDGQPKNSETQAH